jgi:hypothetical protein
MRDARSHIGASLTTGGQGGALAGWLECMNGNVAVFNLAGCRGVADECRDYRKTWLAVC